MVLEIKTYSNKGTKVKAVLFGDSGTGKTSFAGTALPDYKTLFISAESGLASIRKGQTNPRTQIKSESDLDVLQINSFDDIKELNKKNNLQKITKGYELIVIDSLTEISDRIKSGMKGDKPYLTLQDRGVLGEELKEFVIKIRDLDKHVLVICQEKIEKDGDNVIRYQPSVDGGFKDKIPYYFDIVARIIKGEAGQRFILVEDDDKSPAKTRFNDIINNSTETSLATWINLINSDAENAEEEQIINSIGADDYKKYMDKAGFANEDSAKSIYNYLSEERSFEEIDKLKNDLKASPKFNDKEKKQAIKYIDLLLKDM